MGEYLVHSAEGFAGLAESISGKGKDGIETFLSSPAPLIILGVAAILLIVRKLR
ncbi:hypothetical protein H0I76_10780 [Limibaculum sp. M0105]|uniref:Uncharacterized protein n=1 Tax=Thermohalobaculum xanthum TaxID=2753746 RepID=A0A8J7M8K4_9RHOB|nr:hypothetical protein [Thermohalobaculum xanthum]MBK0399678.1 hypothetical protein [Thermohalobaculum xanthum]